MSIGDWLGDAPLQRRSRAVVKTVLYRVVMILITVAVTLVVTGDLNTAFQVGIAANAVKTVTYYGYERAWDRISWGVEAGN